MSPAPDKECGCPVYVRRCIHIDGDHVLTLVDRLMLPFDVQWQFLRSTDKRYYVSTNEEFDSYSDAVAAFQRAELEGACP